MRAFKQTVTIHNQSHPFRRPIIAGYCRSFGERLRGYMFTPSIARQEGLLLVQDRQNRADAAIHMFFMNFDLAVVWINNDLQVVDTCLAYRWRPLYMPAKPARYVLETHTDHLSDFRLGDCLSFNITPADE